MEEITVKRIALMKRIVPSLLLLGLVVLNNDASTLATRPSASAEDCPALPVRIVKVTVSPLQPAPQHMVNVSWEAKRPQCYTINKFSLKGVITFANGEKKGFVQTAHGNQSTVQIQVPGLLTLPALANPSLAPRSVEVVVSAEASAPVIGVASNFPPPAPGAGDIISAPPNSCLPLVEVSGVQASFSGLVVSPENPIGTHFPKFKVIWRVNALPSCYKIDNFSVTVTLIREQKSKTVTVAGGQTATEIIFDNFPVSADFRPGVIGANVKATGTARVTGSAQIVTQLNQGGG
jgi:hypothetical protein